MNTKKDYRDGEGLQRRVLLPADEINPEEGIPLSLPVDRLFEHMPLVFRQRLIDELWAVGLIEAQDFLAPNAPNRIRAALLAVVKNDTFDILALAKETVNHGK